MAIFILKSIVWVFTQKYKVHYVFTWFKHIIESNQSKCKIKTQYFKFFSPTGFKARKIYLLKIKIFTNFSNR